MRVGILSIVAVVLAIPGALGNDSGSGIDPKVVKVVARGGVNYHYCGGVWYQPAYQGTTVVYVVEDVDPGTEAYVEVEE